MKEELNKIVKGANEDRSEAILGIIWLMYLILLEIAAIAVAVNLRNYLLLSGVTYIWVWMLTECFVKKYLFKKLYSFLIKAPRTSGWVFFILFCITAIFSWEYFVAFMFCIIEAFIYGQFCRFKKIKNKKEEFK